MVNHIPNSTLPDVEIVETFTDSINVGEKGRNSIRIIKYRVFDDTYLIIKFYIKQAGQWLLQNTYQYETNASMGLQPDIRDFNNDQLNDITIIAATAARGANEVRRLFIYDAQAKQLVSIVNAEDYPNMRYNPELDCIDAFLVHGGSSTIFAKIKGDSLKTFASVHNDLYRTVYKIDADGNEQLIRKDTIITPDDIYIRYKNFDPLREY
ncbi:hypothetical protein LQ567_25185 [Niabella pedocola]|uniref:Uncharacterized protein n=1 Tax=Niabella pedocola TaxID=1752077 RepID=A0ABS8PYH2_9BACT|nr:hypothetical protein [Niabella pedocola]MCD2426103.1 hypothetical protein [Niabella pedocola]